MVFKKDYTKAQTFAAPNKHHISLICFITAAVDELNYKASRSSLVALLKRRGNRVPMRGICRVSACWSRLKGGASRLSHDVSLCLVRGWLPLGPLLTQEAGVQKETGETEAINLEYPSVLWLSTSLGYSP